MNVSLTPEFEKLVHEKVSSGMYPTVSDVIKEGLRLLRDRDQDFETLRRDIEAGFEAVRRGEYTEYDGGDINELADRVKRGGRESLSRELNAANG